MGYTVSMTDIFPTCAKILDEEKRPIHYRTLTTMALEFLEIPASQVDYFRQIEDVREKLPYRNGFGVAYTKEPYCLMVKRKWFNGSQLFLINSDPPLVIPGNVSSGITGAYIALKRTFTENGLIQKNPNASNDTLYRGRARGLVIEHHVNDWFRNSFPGLIFPADNEGQWDRPCNHDFKIVTSSHSFNVDVMGPNARGEYIKPPYKKGTDLHLLCRVSENGKDVLFEGFETGKRYAESDKDLLPEKSRSPIQLIVWLNCELAGIDYAGIRRALQ